MAVRITEKELTDNVRVLVVEGIAVEHPNIEPDGHALVDAVVDVQIAPPREDAAAFEKWVKEEVTSAIRTKDDGQALRPSIWPDGSEHTVRRAWANPYPHKAGYEQVSVWRADQQFAPWMKVRFF